MKSAEIVSVGTELLMGQIADTNAQAIGQLLPELGIAHHFRQTVGDNLGRLTETLRLALSRADVIFTIGGLGPTEDDLTRDGIAAALGEPLVADPELETHLRRLFAQRNLPWTDRLLRQAQRPAIAEAIDNPNGTAPGLWCEKDGKVIVALPGPRGEFHPMLRGPVRERLIRLAGDQILVSRLLKVAGMGESMIEEQLNELVRLSNPTVAPYAKTGEVHLRLTAAATDQASADRLLDPLEAEIRRRLGSAIFGVGDETLDSAVIQLLRDRRETLGTAESLTGGGLGQRITGVPGASAVFRGGIVAYSVETKAQLLGIDVTEGPVSSDTALKMARAARERLRTDWAVSTTGNAGPEVDADQKPVGWVSVAVAGPNGEFCEESRFRGRREEIRTRTLQSALTLLRRRILEAAS